MKCYKNLEDMFLKKAGTCKKYGDWHWAKALEAQSKGKLADEVEEQKKQAWHYYNAGKEYRQKAVENKGKIWEKKAKGSRKASCKKEGKPLSS